MLVMPPREKTRREREEYEKRQNQIMQGLLNNYDTETVVSDNATVEDCIEAPLKEFKICGKDIKQETETENLIDNEWEQGILNDNGIIMPNSTTIRTKNFIKVYSNHLYKISRSVSTDRMNFRFYDKNYNYLGNQALEGMVTSNRDFNQMQANVSSIEITILNPDVAYMKLNDLSNDLSTIYTMTTEAINLDYLSELEYVEGCQDIEHVNKNLAYNIKYYSPLAQYNPNIIASYKLKFGKYYAISFDTENTGKSVYINSGSSYGYTKISSEYAVSCDGTRKSYIIKALDDKFHKNQSVVNRNSNSSDIATGYTRNFMIEEIQNITTDEDALAYESSYYVEHQSEKFQLDLTENFTHNFVKEISNANVDSNNHISTATGYSLIVIKANAGNYHFKLKSYNQLVISSSTTLPNLNEYVSPRLVVDNNEADYTLENSGYLIVRYAQSVYATTDDFLNDLIITSDYGYSYPLYSENNFIYYNEKTKEYFVHNEWGKEEKPTIVFKHTTLVTDKKGLYKINLPNKFQSNDFGSALYCKCDYLKARSGSSSQAFNNNDDGIWWENSSNAIYLILPFTTIQEAQAWIDEVNLSIAYKLENPTDTKITDEILIKQLDKLRKMFTYEGKNHFIVTSENGQSANLKAIVYKDTFKILKEEIDNLKALLLES